jgi:hypothetical protein
MNARRMLIATLTLFAMVVPTASQALSSKGPHDPGRPLVFRPPFSPGTGLGYKTFLPPCIESASPVQSLSPDPEKGRIDHSEGFAGKGCASVTGGLSNTWNVGNIPAPFVGRPATVSLIVEVLRVRTVGTGNAKSSHAAGSISIAGLSWITANIDCEGGTCSTNQMHASGPRHVAHLSGHVDSLPTELELGIHRNFAFTSGSGSIGVEFVALVQSIVVVPLA